MFNDKQMQVLGYDLDASRIKNRLKGSISLAYLEGFDIIETANKIFGYGNWSYAISSLEQVSEETNANENIVICYKAVVSVVVHDLHHSKHISREDVGFGTGISKSLSDAHEGAAKEAVTDAVKRSFRSFGNQFGNSLYDKSRSPGSSSPEPPKEPHPHSQEKRDEYASLYRLGLSVITQGDTLIVTGEDIFGNKERIKACGFRWDSASKQWYKPIERQAA